MRRFPLSGWQSLVGKALGYLHVHMLQEQTDTLVTLTAPPPPSVLHRHRDAHQRGGARDDQVRTVFPAKRR